MKNTISTLFIILFTTIVCYGQQSINEVVNTSENYRINGANQRALHYIDSASNHHPDHPLLVLQRIKILYQLKDQSYGYALKLDSTISHFNSHYSTFDIGEKKNDELLSIYVDLKLGIHRDRHFYKVMSEVDYKDSTVLIKKIDRIYNYLNITPGTAYQNELTLMRSNYSDTLEALRDVRKKQERKLRAAENILNMGRFSFVEFRYLFPSGGDLLNAVPDEESLHLFLQGKSPSQTAVIPDWSIGASLINFGINAGSTSRMKWTITLSLLDFDMHVFNNADTAFLLKKSGFDYTLAEQVISYKVGMRFGIMPIFRIGTNQGFAPYAQIKPGIIFLQSDFRYTLEDGGTEEVYDVTRKPQTWNFASELGFRYYFNKRFYIGGFVHFGRFNWQTEVSLQDTEEVLYDFTSENKFQYYGVKIGL